MQSGQEAYPLQRSFIEQRFGTAAAGLVQFNSRDLVDRVSASTLAGAVISAANAPIGTLEFDALTVLAVRFADDGDKERHAVSCSLGSLLSMLGITLGTWQRRDLAIALKRLYDVSLELPEFDEDGNEIGVRARRLFTELAIYADSAVLRELDATKTPRGRDLTRSDDTERSSRFVQIADAEHARVEITLAGWFAEAVLERSGKVLDLETQRALDGVAKRVWVALSMLAYVQHETLDIETHTREVDDRLLGMLRLKAKRPTDNRKTLTKALRKVLVRDPSYCRAQIVRRGGRYMLEVERLTGAARQGALRERQRQNRETPAATAA
jgi:hypothetical protein